MNNLILKTVDLLTGSKVSVITEICNEIAQINHKKKIELLVKGRLTEQDTKKLQEKLKSNEKFKQSFIKIFKNIFDDRTDIERAELYYKTFLFYIKNDIDIDSLHSLIHNINFINIFYIDKFKNFKLTDELPEGASRVYLPSYISCGLIVETIVDPTNGSVFELTENGELLIKIITLDF